MGQLGEFLLECIQTTKNSSIIGRNGENRPISLINGRDETVHRGPFQLSHDRRIEDGRPE